MKPRVADRVAGASIKPTSVYRRQQAATHALAFALFATGMVPSAHAQVQRSIINGSFEVPQIGDPSGSGACQGYVYASRVTGWQTTDPPLTSPTADFDNPNGCNNNPEPAPVGGTRVFEYYTSNAVDNQTNFARSAPNGRNYVELNAHTAARLYQNMCVVPGETVGFSFSHLGRRNANVVDTARLQIGGTSVVGSGQTVVTVGTANDGTPTTITAGLSTNATSALGASSGNGGNWRVYSGSFVVPAGVSGVQEIAFEAVCSASGTGGRATCTAATANIGNLLDNIVINLNPVVELVQDYSATEGSTPYPDIQFRVVGVVQAGGINVSFSRTGGTATLGTDYTINGGSAANFTFNVPAGDYGTGALFSIPVSVVDDAVMEPTENFVLGLNAGTGYTVGPTLSCGATPIASSTYTIRDNDATIVITKDTVPNDAQDFAFTTTGTGLPAFSLDDDADPTLPNSRTFVVAAGTYTVTEAAVAGWALTGLVCTDPTSNSTGNVGTRTATINAAVGETVACTFTNSSTSADLAIAKTRTPTGNVTAGQTIGYTLAVSNNGPATATGAIVTDSPQSGLSCPAANTVTCTGSGCPAGALTVGQLTGTGITLGTLAAGQSLTLTFNCTAQ